MNEFYSRSLSSHKKGGKGKILLFLVAIILTVGGFFWYEFSKYTYYLQTPVSPIDNKDISFVIKNGDRPPVVAQKLKEKDLILDESTFNWYVRLENIDRDIIAGRFLLNKTMTIPQIVENITDRKKAEFILTVPEGATIKEIDQKLVNLELIEQGEFIQATKSFSNYQKYPFLEENGDASLPHPLEGFLFPDTYFLDPNNFKSLDLIDIMLKNFQRKVPDELLAKVSQASSSGNKKERSLFQIITMASIVEKEVRTDKDRPIVAGILWKRLDEGWQLGADATLLYLKNDRDIDANDLKEDSPYNTRKNLGLPPGPISNPGLKSIMAAFQPEKSDYYFYLTKPENGEVVYGRTNEEHNENRAKYL